MSGRGKIIIDGETRTGDTLKVKGEARENLILWRSRIGEAFTISDKTGRLFRARLTIVKEKEATLLVFEGPTLRKTPPLEITLLQALPEKERMELIIQKTTELGVSRIIPFKSKKSISLEERERGQRKSHRWNEVALKASKQSRRDTISEVLPYTILKDALDGVGKDDIKIMLSEMKDITGIKDLLAGIKRNGNIKGVTLLTGPEGGLTEEETKEAINSGFTPVSLGPRILRTETASIIGVGIIQHELGE